MFQSYQRIVAYSKSLQEISEIIEYRGGPGIKPDKGYLDGWTEKAYVPNRLKW